MKYFSFFLLLFQLSFFVFSQQKLTLESIYTDHLFQPELIHSLNWTQDSRYYTAKKNNKIIEYDIATGEERKVLIDTEITDPKLILDDYQILEEQKKILLLTQKEPIYRRSYKANYYIYDMQTDRLQRLSSQGKQSFATLSPDGKYVGFVRKNNIYMVSLSTMEERMITQKGVPNQFIYGATDWVYEEEFAFTKAFYWSPDSKRIAYYEFDETEVKEFNMQLWNPMSNYPKNYKFKYPKAGEKNSVIQLYCYDIESQKHITIPIEKEKDAYIPRVKWTKDNEVLSVTYMNRLQNLLEIWHVNVSSLEKKKIYQETSDTYIDINYCNELVYVEGSEKFIFSSEKNGYKHLYLYDGKKEEAITEGNWEVHDFLGFDDRTQTIYYTSTEPSPLEEHFYSIDIKNKRKVKLTTTSGIHSIDISPDFKYYIDTHQSFDRPYKVDLIKTGETLPVTVLYSNDRLQENIKKYDLSHKELFYFKNQEGTTLYAWIIKPKDFDENKKYPVIVHLYGGPGSQLVKNAWGGNHYYWHQFMAQKGYIVAVVDNRGTDGRGVAFKKTTYKQLGKKELEDQISFVEYLTQFPYIDKERVGVWGWSYGGYMTSLCMTMGAQYFKAGIAVAPVSWWKLYDSIYTERYLQRPSDNPSGYEDYSPIYHADKLKGRFLLIHGTGDDNVHFQNSILLQDALIKAGKQFESFYYPNRNHGIYGGNTRLHLFEMMTNFFEKNL